MVMLNAIQELQFINFFSLIVLTEDENVNHAKDWNSIEILVQ